MTNATDIGEPEVDRAAAAAELPLGLQLGVYRIDSVLGRGGMGVVYRATDTKLHRAVAIKLVSATIADGETRRRFRLEAETASSLNHPHIVTVHDVSEHDGRQFIVSELVDGGTLDDWSRKRRPTWRQCVELLTGVADGVAAAHAAGVLHRDIKPGNILIGTNGYAKLADFGLAKLIDSPANAPREASARKTRVGLIVGTAAYMSPEQAAGEALDARSDVFSFGIVLYELLAGSPPFDGAKDLEVLQAITHATPAPLPHDIPEPLRIAVDKALEKDPAERYQTMRELVVDLRRASRKSGVQSRSAIEGVRPRGFLPWALAAGLAAAALAALAVALYLRAPASGPALAMRFETSLPGYARDLALSPDGRHIAYTGGTDSVPRIWVRPIDVLEARALPSTENAAGLFWSADSRELGFFADGKLKRVAIASGEVQAVVDVTLTAPGAWTRDGQILYTGAASGDSGSAIVRVPIGGGAATPVTAVDGLGDQFLHVAPHMLPDDTHFVFLNGSVMGEATLVVSSLATPEQTPLASVGGHAPAYAEGSLLFVRNGTLFAQHFDVEARALRGEAQPLAHNVGEFSVSRSGVLVYASSTLTGMIGDRMRTALDERLRTLGGPVTQRHLVWLNRSGERVGQVDAPTRYAFPMLSPDGRSVALSAFPPGSGVLDLWTIDAERGALARITFDPRADSAPIWSPDGAWIAFDASGENMNVAFTNRILRRAANGTGVEELLFTGVDNEITAPLDWSSDGELIIFMRMAANQIGTVVTLWALPLRGDRVPFPLVQTPFLNDRARLSPNGRWMAYNTNESGESQIVVQPFPELAAGRWQISTRSGYEPKWRSDGRELFYLDADGTMMAVDVFEDGPFRAGPPRELFETGLNVAAEALSPTYLFHVTPDGEQFLINEPLASGASGPVTEPARVYVVVNWAAALEAN